ncbi:MAG: Type prepilin peptidase TadV/CpaA [Phycisphaerales bacterium]|nr:Type prepilin peptidase TadV/CpaA [Phycisphaerales bacterium]
MRHWHLLAPYVPLAALLVWAAVADARTRRIRNWLTLSLAATGFAQSWFAAGTVGPGGSVLGLLAGGGLLIVPFALGALGGGDVKLLAGIGAWLGPVLVFQVFLAESVIGLGIVLAQATAAGKLRRLVRNSAAMAVDLAHVNVLGADHAEQVGRQLTSIDRPLPYAVPTLAAAAVVVWANVMG